IGPGADIEVGKGRADRRVRSLGTNHDVAPAVARDLEIWRDGKRLDRPPCGIDKRLLGRNADRPETRDRYVADVSLDEGVIAADHELRGESRFERCLKSVEVSLVDVLRLRLSWADANRLYQIAHIAVEDRRRSLHVRSDLTLPAQFVVGGALRTEIGIRNR